MTQDSTYSYIYDADGNLKERRLLAGNVLDQRYSHLFRRDAYVEKSVIVFGSMEATLTPLMEQVERDHPAVKVFSLPSVDHPEYGRHIDLGVKGSPGAVEPAYAALVAGLGALGVRLGPELVRS